MIIKFDLISQNLDFLNEGSYENLGILIKIVNMMELR
jgi:hypothetical protein